VLHRSQRITLRNIRAMTDTVHECRELWADPWAWQAHLLRRAAAFAGCRIGLYFEMADDDGAAANRILAANDCGWESATERHTVVEGLADRPLRYSPLWAAFADKLRASNRTAFGVTAGQDQIIAASQWESSEMYDRHVRPTRLGQVLLSGVWLPHLSCWTAWSLVTDRGDQAPGTRNERLIRMLHRQIAPLVGTKLSTWRDRNVSWLTPTRRRVLESLLDGKSEPEIAKDSFRSRSAVHEHVTAVYRHFGVRSRGDLGAFFLRRKPVPSQAPVVPPLPRDWLDRPWIEFSASGDAVTQRIPQ
jgi:DNA-binding CsgD family transcriptional regulator